MQPSYVESWQRGHAFSPHLLRGRLIGSEFYYGFGGEIVKISPPRAKEDNRLHICRKERAPAQDRG